MGLRATQDFVVVRPIGRQHMSDLIVIPDPEKGAKNFHHWGVVQIVGPGAVLADGTRAPMECKPGNQVYYKRYPNEVVEMRGTEYHVVNQDRVMLVSEAPEDTPMIERVNTEITTAATKKSMVTHI